MCASYNPMTRTKTSDKYLANNEVDVTGLEEGDLVAELLHHGVLALALAVAGRL